MKFCCLKNCFLLFVLFFVCEANAQLDTIITFQNFYGKATKGPGVYSVRMQWKSGKEWAVQDYYWPEKTIKLTGSYSDSAGRQKHGLFRSYYKNGIEKDSCYYWHGKKNGLCKEWYEDGNQSSQSHYNIGTRVDTCVTWSKEGKLQSVYIADSAGTGIEQLYNPDGKIKSKGRYFNSKKTGLWSYKDEAGILSQEVTYDADSAISIICYDEKGVIETKADCVVEKNATFKDGSDGFRRYLERKLQYPVQAQKNGVQGTVTLSFKLDTEGKPVDIIVEHSPDEELSKEALRIIRTSPNWEPAIQYNRKVFYRLLQSITFALQ